MKQHLCNNIVFSEVLVVLGSIAGCLVLVNTFWFHDDWYFLANAAGLADLGKGGSRWFGYNAYWKVFFPFFGLNPVGWGITRLLFHGGSVWLVVRIGRKLGLEGRSSLAPGLLFAASPVAFESLYWGTGAIELMGVFFALASIDRWLCRGNSAVVFALVFGVLAVGSKEPGLILPVFFLAHMVASKQFTPFRISVVGLLGLASVVAVFLLKTDLANSAEYAISLACAPKNFMILGFWLVAPPPFQTGNEIDLMWAYAIGGMFWITWLLFAFRNWRAGNRTSLWALVICVMAMVPALPLETHIVPRYNYGPAAAAAIGISLLVRDRISDFSYRWTFLAILVVILWTGWGTHYRLNSTYPKGRPIHRLVVKEEISRKLCQGLTELGLEANDRLVFYLDPSGEKKDAKLLYDALAGELGPRLVLGNGVSVKWVSSLGLEDRGAYVVSVKGFDLEPMGRYSPRN